MGKGPHDGSEHVCFSPSDPPDLGKSFSSSFQYNFKIEVFLKTGETDSGMRLSAKKRAIDLFKGSPDKTERGQLEAPECGSRIMQPGGRELISQHLILLSTESDAVHLTMKGQYLTPRHPQT